MRPYRIATRHSPRWDFSKFSTIFAASVLKILHFARLGKLQALLISHGPAFIIDRVCEDSPPDRAVTPVP